MTDFENAIESVCWYNGLAPVVAAWADLEAEGDKYKIIPCPDNYLLEDEEYYSANYHQLQVIWMICVELFGNCGTSPRTGFIEKIDEFREFCKTVTNGPLEWERDECDE